MTKLEILQAVDRHIFSKEDFTFHDYNLYIYIPAETEISLDDLKALELEFANEENKLKHISLDCNMITTLRLKFNKPFPKDNE